LKTGSQNIFPASFSGKPHGIVSGLVFYGILENKKNEKKYNSFVILNSYAQAVKDKSTEHYL
jgi:hypothetical protein